eukprot:CAMPEP_0206487064 /NCGR_PEP_ID=MMETSP0324_2-20121206/41392_1 /ASSEMBLY_ACC=CAM_ASM_000836 /TAXON_ID=2866 /ORGANISM="Crypthecodinium cohnii, Strain Seligo" /LENGTH=422 /DNA_ID=CAMNT_0053965421 /DNA_START=74 /DNA_END=1342 /DNA_ORIENTATION=-
MGSECSFPTQHQEHSERTAHPDAKWDPKWNEQAASLSPTTAPVNSPASASSAKRQAVRETDNTPAPSGRPAEPSNVRSKEEAEGCSASPTKKAEPPPAATHGPVPDDPVAMWAVAQGGYSSERSGKGKGRGKGRNKEAHSGPPEVRKFRAEIAEQNYTMRRRFPLPDTLPVTWTESVNWLSKADLATQPRPQISFSGLSTADALLMFCHQYPESRSTGKVCGLNFANGTNVGGGYKSGALAQEEDLCRRMPNLYSSLYNAKQAGLYPFGPSTFESKENPGKYCDALFTPNLVIARHHEEKGFELLDQQNQKAVSLVTAAAPNINFADEVKDLELMYNTVQTILAAPRIHEPSTEVLVLGAWGCGAFGGNATEICDLFVRAIQNGLGNGLKHIHFAIPRGDKDQNAEVFRRCFQSQGFKIVEM